MSAVHPALAGRGLVASALGVALQAAAFTALAHGAMALLGLAWPPLWTFGGALALFTALELRVRSLGRGLRAPAVALASEVAARWPEAKVRKLRGLPVVEGRRDGRWFALHFESAGLDPVRVGVTVAAEMPVALWAAARLPVDPPAKAESRLRLKRRFVEVEWPAGADARLVGLSPDPSVAEPWLAEPAQVARVEALLLPNAPATATLELFGDSARWDTRLVPERVDADRVEAVVDALLAWFPAEAPPMDEAPASAGEADDGA